MAARWLLASLACACAASVQCAYGQSPLTVDQAVNEAIDHNLALAASRYGLQLADAAIVTASLRPNPVLTLGVQQPQAVLKDAGIAVEDEMVHGDYLVERGGKRRLRVDVAQAAKSVAELQLLDAVRQLRLDVQTAFADVQEAELNVQLAQDNLQAFNDVVNVNRERVRAGDLSQVELERSRLAALQFENDVRQQQSKLRIARGHLSTLLGRGPDGDGLQITGELRVDSVGLDLDALRRLALETRPDLQAARRDQARTTADARLQIANGKVDYTLSAEYHHQRGGGLDGHTVGAFVSVPLPLFNRNQGEIARARSQAQQAAVHTEALGASVANEVGTAYVGWATARDILHSIEGDMLQQARDVRTATEYSYRRGEASFVEFLDAVRAFNDTMQSYHAARADYARSLFTLEALAGKVTP